MMKCICDKCPPVIVASVVVLLLSLGTKAETGENLVVNGGFEEGMSYWSPGASGAQAGWTIEPDVARNGMQSLRLTNASAFGPNVWSRVSQTVTGIEPFTTYRISAQVKGEDVGINWIGGGPGWGVRAHFPKGTFDWTEVSIEYTTGEYANDFDLMILSEGETKALWTDDVRFEAIRTGEEKLVAVRRGFAEKVDEQKDHLRRIEQLAGELKDDTYVQLGLSVARRFMKRIIDGPPQGKQSVSWSMLQLQEIDSVLKQTEQRIAELHAGEKLPGMVRWPVDGDVEIRDGVFYTPERSAQEKGPFYFSGYGHFDTLFRTLPEFRDLGVSLIQDGRIGPSSMNADGTLRENALATIRGFKDAAKHGVKVDFLISPHYFPEWGYEQAPDLLNQNAGFLHYNIDHPRGREIMEQWLRKVVPQVKDSPSLLSYCLSNEPVYVMSGRDPYSRPKFNRYLESIHGSVEELNDLYGTQYESFDAVPPAPQGLPEGTHARRAYYDWCRFNQLNFAAWHKWLNDVVKSIDPDAKTHAKLMVFWSLDRDKLHFGTDPELFCEVTDVAGCDAYGLMTSGNTFDWQGQEFWYDLLHSFRNQPVFNSENHLIDNLHGPTHIPQEHTRAVLWQGGLHHMGASTMWVWEEPVAPALHGSIYFRPANIYAAGRAMLDQNRLARELTAINQAKPRVALLYSQPSVFWSETYKSTIIGLYTHLNFLGEKVTFVSERQLADDRAADVDVIITPTATHVKDETVEKLAAFVRDGGKVIVCSEADLRFDQYHRQRELPEELRHAPRLKLGGETAANHQQVRAILTEAGITLHRLNYAEKEGDTWNVEYRIVDYDGAVLVPLINLAGEMQTVRLQRELRGKATDLLSGDEVNLSRIELEPMVPRLLRVDEQAN